MPETTSQTLEPTLQRSEVDTMGLVSIGNKDVEVARPPEELSLEEGVQRLIRVLDAWLFMKAKDKLTIQLFEGNLNEASINVEGIVEAIEKEAALEQMRHKEDAQSFRAERIELDGARVEPKYEYEKRRDMEHLQQHEMIHASLAAYIADKLQTKDWAIELAKENITLAKEGARKEAAKSLRTQVEAGIQAEARARKAGQQALLN